MPSKLAKCPRSTCVSTGDVFFGPLKLHRRTMEAHFCHWIKNKNVIWTSHNSDFFPHNSDFFSVAILRNKLAFAKNKVRIARYKLATQLWVYISQL